MSLVIYAPRKSDEAVLSLTVDSIFEEFLGKMMKLTIEEIEE